MAKLNVMPSLLSANFSNVNKEMDKLKEIGISEIHYDVMDGNFVPNISFGSKILKEIKDANPTFEYDVHLMINKPEDYLDSFIEAGSTSITWHIETGANHADLIKKCKKNNIKSGLSLKPKTSINDIEKYINDIDIILVMSVEPGFGGQKFIESSLEKMKDIQLMIKKHNSKAVIYVDGGINDKIAKLCREQGVHSVVAGNYLFSAKDMKKALKDIHE